ncbi:MAG: hypothetical protein CM1200mP30_30540 [Pseudomonadota bacterium]|nr:MAG: hypothetical protein CM1200mP30_30540 [Pseudomonadota bacterium]
MITKASPAYPTSAVSPSLKLFSKSSNLNLTLSIRVGLTSVASIENDKSRTSTLACDFLIRGCGFFCQAGPARDNKSSVPAKHINPGEAVFVYAVMDLRPEIQVNENKPFPVPTSLLPPFFPQHKYHPPHKRYC